MQDKSKPKRKKKVEHSTDFRTHSTRFVTHPVKPRKQSDGQSESN